MLNLQAPGDEDQAGAAIPATLVIALDPPIEVNKAVHAELALREPTLAQVREAQMKLDDAVMPSIGAQRDYELTFVGLVAGKQRAVVDMLPVRALFEAVRYLERFVALAPGEPAGADELDPQAVIALDPPLKAPGGGEVHELLLHEPTGGELRRAEDLLGKQASPLPGPVRRYQARLIELVSGQPALVVGQLPITKAKEAIRFLEGFERSARATATK